MPLSKDKIEKISLEVIKVLYSRFKNYPEDNSKIRNAPFHRAFLTAFENKIKDKISDVPTFLSLSNWLHGLSGILGQTFFENVAGILCAGEKRVYTNKNKKYGRLKIHPAQAKAINLIMDELGRGISPNRDIENNKIFITDNRKLVPAKDFTADVFFIRRKELFAIELKTVQPNSTEMESEKRKILSGKAALFIKFPNHKIHFFLGFPFDPTCTTSITGFDKNKFIKSVINLKKFFAKDEFLIASELWNFLSGQKNTMEEIIKIINSIASIDFIENYEFLNESKNRTDHSDEYKMLLEQWNLFSELEMFDELQFEMLFNETKAFTKIYKKKIFKDGKYDGKRFEELKSLISN